MQSKKGQKFQVPDLKAKVRTLEAVFGEKFMRSELNPRTVDKWLKEPDPTPYLTSLKRYFGVIGMKESDMIKSKQAFSEKAAMIYAQQKSAAQVQYSVEDILAVYESFAEDHSLAPAMLSQTLKMVQKETIKNDYKYLSGYYHMYHYWKSGDIKDTGKVRRNLIHVYELDERQGLLNCRLMISPMKHQKEEDWWAYEGWMLNIRNKLFWLFECIRGMPPEIVTFNIFKPSFWPDPDRFILYGILSALSLEGVPCASNMMLMKIKSDDALKNKIGYFTPEEIQAEGHPIDIVKHLANETQNPHDILTIKSTA